MPEQPPDELPPERRHQQPGRRVADTVAATGAIAYEIIDEDVKEIAIALTKIQRGWKRWAAVVAAVVTIVSGTVGVLIWLGWSQSSPNQRFIEHDQSFRLAMSNVTDDVATLETRVANVEDALDLVSYLLCVQIRRTDPAAVPPRCNDPSLRNLAPR